LIILFAALFVFPFAVAGRFYFFPSSDQAAVIDRYYRILRIENPSLHAEDVTLSSERVKGGSLRSFTREEHRKLYYEGRKRYLPEVREEGDILFVGKPLDAADDDPLRLHVPAAITDTVILNGELIYGR
jgi:hypothetical protein